MAKILVVDDSETARVQVKLDLVGAGHDVVEAENGIKGLEALNANLTVKRDGREAARPLPQR